MAQDLEIIPGRWIGDGRPSFIVAEVGINHNGDAELAKELIRKAKQVGADCVKFQISDLSAKFSASALRRPHASAHSFGPTYGDHKRSLELARDTYRELKAFAETEVGLCLSASAMDAPSLDFLADELGADFVKIGSGDANNLPLVRAAAAKRKNLIISTGMSDMSMVQRIYDTVKEVHTNFVLMQCTSCYPTRPENVNLNVLSTYKQVFPDIHIGYSGHEEGFVPTLGALALGAKVIERHITLDKTMKGSDHCCSLDVAEFAQLVRSIRSLELALGSPVKKFQLCEEPCFRKLGKSVVAARDLEAGRRIERDDLCIKVAEPPGWPAVGIDELVGKELLQDVAIDESIRADDVVDYGTQV